ncbi:RNA-binding protein [Gluconacetobacter tumulisoli]|uniref:RNA-binding protein n=1 Tax=Gluconacetobacter tumulisoli TaxID=1286189 RepID=A0A7W4K8D6_9PROT|nr:RNA-binding protein [Gluconacetobacter tumulisoli]MBB2202188.1 RNA-binding protein [Gluconacetobacter tumulisoli]
MGGDLDENQEIDREDEAERGPLRRCIVTRDRAAPETMVRFVLSPDRVLTPDLSARLPGRGIWLSARRDVLETARTRGAFARAARGQVVVPPDLADILESGLLRRMMETVGLARRAGQVVCGFAKVREWIAGGRAGLVIQAEDGSPDERTRLLSGARDLPVAEVPTAAGLGAAFGRDHVVHAAMSHGELARRFRVDNERFTGLSGRTVPGSADRSAGRV